MPPSNTRARQLIAEAGRTLYGEYWQGNFLRRMGITRDSLRDWLNGKNASFDMSHWAWPKIEALLRDARTPATIRLADTIKAEALPSSVQKPDTPSGPKARLPFAR